MLLYAWSSAPGGTARSRRRTRGVPRPSSGRCPNPIPLENFAVLPVVIEDPYGYGEPAGPEPAPAPVPAGAEAGPEQGEAEA